MTRQLTKLLCAVLACGVLILFAAGAGAAPPVSGAIFTTDAQCSGVNVNIYGSKDDVYLNGGPAHPGAAGLPDGAYYVQVTVPNGAQLGTSVGALDSTPVHVINGTFAGCYQLSAILVKTSDNTAAGYDDTTNPGGEYKVWVSNVSTFDNDSTKTDNFKVIPGTLPSDTAKLGIDKFYDANANGVWDNGEVLITGWRFRIHDGMDIVRETPLDLVVAPDAYNVSEFSAVESNWVHTTPTSVDILLAAGDDKTLMFGNVCLGAGGGLTLGFWSNKNGQALMGPGDLVFLTSLNLRDAAGGNFDPAPYAAFRTWLLNAAATNLAYMLAAQLATMELNVAKGKVNGASLGYAPGASSANALGFATVAALMSEANVELGTHGMALSGDAWRSYQEALKTALDQANNNVNFVQATACPFSFAP